MKFQSQFQRNMWLGALISLICWIAFQLLYAAHGGALISALRVTALTIFYHLAVRLAFGEWLIPKLDLRKLNYENAWFRLHHWEGALYRRLGVSRWKRSVPTYDPAEFDLRRGAEALIWATCRAELVHEFGAAASFVPLLFSIPFGAFPIFLITSVLAAVFDLMFVAVQRYNRPRMIRMMQMQRR